MTLEANKVNYSVVLVCVMCSERWIVNSHRVRFFRMFIHCDDLFKCVGIVLAGEKE